MAEGQEYEQSGQKLKFRVQSSYEKIGGCEVYTTILGIMAQVSIAHTAQLGFDCDSRTDSKGYGQPLDAVGQEIKAVLMANSTGASDYH